jgi:ribosomal protein S18 acetylase RimI-like enzyme
MPSISVDPCFDVFLLSPLFLELAEDEKSDINRTMQKASEEMAGFLEFGEKAFLFSVSGETAGYALVNMNRKPPYLHHFYICRGVRRKGYGTMAFRALLDALGINEIDLDVYAWNDRGKSFWESLGFKPRAIIMRYRQ